MKKDIQIISENEYEIWALCCFHEETKPSLLISKTGEFAGFYKCFGCGKFGKASELNIKRDWKKETKNYPKINWEDINIELVNKLKNEDLEYLSKKWNINPLFLIALGVGWNNCYTFPMRSNNNKIIGIQRRFETKELSGLKLSMESSKLGLFVPQNVKWKDYDTIFITEGLSDLATLLDLGFMGIGRPNANACIDMTAHWLIKRIFWFDAFIVIADADEAGIRGARELTKKCNEFSDAQWILPQQGKDLREWVEIEGKEKVKIFLRNYLQS